MDSQKPTTMGNPNSSRVPFSATVTTFSLTTHNHASNSNGFSLISGETGARRKRGRPRRYGGDGANVKLYRKTGGSSGRSMGWGKKQQFDALGIAGTGFSADMITVKAGEDIGSKIMAFSQLVPYTICILSANGVICNVTLRQPSTYGGTITFEGQFEILSLSGTFSHMDNGGSRSRTGGMSVSLAGSDGRVLGGGVSGGLIAAAPVQVVIGSFIPEEKKLKPQLWKREPLSVPPHMMSFGSPVITVGTPITTVSPPSQDTLSESSDEDCSGGNSGPSNNNIQFSQGAALPYNRWVNSHSMNLHIHGHMTN